MQQHVSAIWMFYGHPKKRFVLACAGEVVLLPVPDAAVVARDQRHEHGHAACTGRAAQAAKEEPPAAAAYIGKFALLHHLFC